MVSVYILVHLRTRREIHTTHHALFKRNSAHVCLYTARLTNLTIDRACRLAEQIILERDMASISR